MMKQAIDDQRITCGIFLDFTKAFDTVNHTILLQKLYAYGIRGLAYEWFKSYLTNRRQFVKIDNAESTFKEMLCGVPQGSTLKPLLFLIYINDLPNVSKNLNFRMFADDTNILYSHASATEVEKVVNEEMKCVMNYCKINKLSVNLKKTNYLIIKSPQKRPKVSVKIMILNRRNL